MEVAHLFDYFLDKFLMLNQIFAPQMVDTRFVPIDEVMDLLGQSIIIGDVDDQIGKHLNGFVIFQAVFNGFDTGRTVPKDHWNPQNGGLFLGQAHHHVLNLDL